MHDHFPGDVLQRGHQGAPPPPDRALVATRQIALDCATAPNAKAPTVDAFPPVPLLCAQLKMSDTYDWDSTQVRLREIRLISPDGTVEFGHGGNGGRSSGAEDTQSDFSHDERSNYKTREELREERENRDDRGDDDSRKQHSAPGGCTGSIIGCRTGPSRMHVCRILYLCQNACLTTLLGGSLASCSGLVAARHGCTRCMLACSHELMKHLHKLNFGALGLPIGQGSRTA